MMPNVAPGSREERRNILNLVNQRTLKLIRDGKYVEALELAKRCEARHQEDRLSWKIGDVGLRQGGPLGRNLKIFRVTKVGERKTVYVRVWLRSRGRWTTEHRLFHNQ